MYTFKRYCRFYCTNFSVFVRTCACVCAHACACVCVCVRACVRACVYLVRARVHIRVRAYVVHAFNGVYTHICTESYELLITLLHTGNVIKPCNTYAGRINYFTVCF